MWMKALPAVTMVPCGKASSCLSSKQETRGAVGLLHMEPEAPKSLTTKHLWTTLQVCFGLHGLLLSIFWDWTVMLPTPVTCSPQIVPKGHYGKISNLVHHRQHLHNQLDSLPACPACASTLQCCCPDNITLRCYIQLYGQQSSIPNVEVQHNPSRTWLFLVIMPGRCAVFRQFGAVF